jgi:hypothetical protein
LYTKEAWLAETGGMGICMGICMRIIEVDGIEEISAFPKLPPAF